MIHSTCPCCEVARPPHRDNCTFAVDCPEACADFDYAANLRLTDDEREAIEVAAKWCQEPIHPIHSKTSLDAMCAADTIRGILKRLT